MSDRSRSTNTVSGYRQFQLATIEKIESRLLFSTVYVATNGSDSWAGTLAQPKLTVQGAINAVTDNAANDIYIRGGTYTSASTISVNKSGSSDTARIVIQPYQNEAVQIVGSGTGSVIQISGKKWITINGLDISMSSPTTQGQEGINIIAGASHVDVLNNTIHDIRSHGIQIWDFSIGAMTDFTIDHNTVYHTVIANKPKTTTGGWAAAIFVSHAANAAAVVTYNNVYENYGEGINSSLCNNVTAKYNIVHDNYSTNMYLDNVHNVIYDRNFVYTTQNSEFYINHAWAGPAPAQGIFLNNETYSVSNPNDNNRVSNNIVIGGLFSIEKEGQLTNSKIVNNTIYGLGLTRRCFNSYSNANDAGNTISNNIFYMANTSWPLAYQNSGALTGVTWSRNLWSRSNGDSSGRIAGTSDVLGLPQFVNAPGNSPTALNDGSDIRLKLNSTSPAINAGSTISGVTTDYFGTARPQGAAADIGAHEYSAVQATLSPTADTYTDQTTSTTNYGTSTSIRTKSTTGFVRQAFFKFDLTSLGTVNSAKMRVYGSSPSAVTMSAYGCDTDTWTETGLTHSNKPGLTGSALSTLTGVQAAGYYEFDVTSYVQAQAAGDNTATLVITGGNDVFTGNSRENTANKPQLVINGTSLTSAGGTATTIAPLTRGDLQREANEAIRRWNLAGASVGMLRNVKIKVADLGDGQLGSFCDNVLTIDDDAAGMGWYIDRNPRTDHEFADPAEVPSGMDLLTALMHEYGHALGLEHNSIPGDVMGGSLATGVRKNPAWADVFAKLA